jgi:hypothetical protein
VLERNDDSNGWNEADTYGLYLRAPVFGACGKSSQNRHGWLQFHGRLMRRLHLRGAAYVLRRWRMEFVQAVLCDSGKPGYPKQQKDNEEFGRNPAGQNGRPEKVLLEQLSTPWIQVSSHPQKSITGIRVNLLSNFDSCIRFKNPMTGCPQRIGESYSSIGHRHDLNSLTHHTALRELK